MGAATSRQAAKMAKQGNTAAPKTPAKMPRQKMDLATKSKEFLEKQYTHLRQVEQEFARQQENPKPAPIRKSKHYENLSEAEKQERRDRADEYLNTEDLGKKLSDQMYDTNFTHDFEDTAKLDEKMAAYTSTVKNNLRRGVQTSSELINLISNHNQDPENWTPEAIAEVLGLRVVDVENIISHYSLIGEEETTWLMPKEMRWNERHKQWITGPDLSQKEDATFNWREIF